MTGFTPEQFAESARRMRALLQGFTIVTQGIAFHSGMKHAIPGFFLANGSTPRSTLGSTAGS